MLNLPLFSSLEPDQVRTVDGDQFCERSHQWFIILGANCWDLCRFPFCCPNLPPWYCGEPAFVLLYQLEQHHDLSSGSNDSFSAYTERSIEIKDATVGFRVSNCILRNVSWILKRHTINTSPVGRTWRCTAKETLLPIATFKKWHIQAPASMTAMHDPCDTIPMCRCVTSSLYHCTWSESSAAPLRPHERCRRHRSRPSTCQKIGKPNEMDSNMNMSSSQNIMTKSRHFTLP